MMGTVAGQTEYESDHRPKGNQTMQTVPACDYAMMKIALEDRIAELEAALRYIQVRTGDDAGIQQHIAAALKVAP